MINNQAILVQGTVRASSKGEIPMTVWGGTVYMGYNLYVKDENDRFMVNLQLKTMDKAVVEKLRANVGETLAVTGYIKSENIANKERRDKGESDWRMYFYATDVFSADTVTPEPEEF